MTGIIVLAAGASIRLGRPKQLLPYAGKVLLQHAIDEAVATAAGPVWVVLGAHAEHIAAAVDFSDVRVVQNPDWASGMGSGIRAGMNAVIEAYPGAERVLIMLCDQPFADRRLLQAMIAAGDVQSGHIIAAAYRDTVGVPALFPQAYFDTLRSLTAEEGAKKLIARHLDAVLQIPFPEGTIDVDTEEDYASLLSDN